VPRRHVRTNPVNQAAAVPQMMIGDQTASSGEISANFPQIHQELVDPNMPPMTPLQIARFVSREVPSLRTTKGTPTATTIRLRRGFTRRACRNRFWLRSERWLKEGFCSRRMSSQVGSIEMAVAVVQAIEAHVGAHEDFVGRIPRLMYRRPSRSVAALESHRDPLDSTGSPVLAPILRNATGGRDRRQLFRKLGWVSTNCASSIVCSRRLSRFRR